MASKTQGLRLVVAIAALSSLCWGQAVLTLPEAARRTGPDLVPLHDGKKVSVVGTAASTPIRIISYDHLAIVDDKGAGFTLDLPPGAFSWVRPGDLLRATGTIAHRSGLPVLRTETLEKTGNGRIPSAIRMTVSQLNDTRNLGRSVSVEGTVLSSGQNAAGDVLLLGTQTFVVAVFLPNTSRDKNAGLRHLRPGDKVRAAGISSQYCPLPPFDRGYQVVTTDPATVVLLDRDWAVSPESVMYVLIGIASAFAIWWIRERTMAEQRRVVRGIMLLSEDLLTAPTAIDIARKLEFSLPSLLNAYGVSLYLANRGLKTLEKVATGATAGRHSVSIDEPVGSLAAAAALCFRNRALLEIPNTRKSPIIDPVIHPDIPNAAVFVPLFAHGEALGVLGLEYRRFMGRMSPDHRAVLQHLGNQIAASLRLEEQQWMREQLLRNEKMAAAGQLISDVADELREPLMAIETLATSAAFGWDAADTALRQIRSLSHSGVEIIDHLIAFSRMERNEPKPLDLFAVLSSVLSLRQKECELKGIRLENALPVSPVQVVMDRGRLEQVFLTLVVHAEQSAAASQDRAVSVSGRFIGKKVQVSIAYSTSEQPGDDTSERFDTRMWQAMVQGQGGDLRLSGSGAAQRADLELPIYEPAAAFEDPNSEPLRRAERVLTLVVVEPELGTQRKLLSMLSVRGHRVVPIEGYDAAAEALQRFRFDAVICEEQLAGSNWIDFFERVRRKISGMVLLTEQEDMQQGPALKSGEVLVLRKPIAEPDLDRILRILEAREPSAQ